MNPDHQTARIYQHSDSAELYSVPANKSNELAVELPVLLYQDGSWE
jgi:hypothetical protein